MNYRHLTEDEILRLKSQSCLADDWGKVTVAEDFVTEFVHHTRFSGNVRLGVFQSEFTLPGGETLRSAPCDATQCFCRR